MLADYLGFLRQSRSSPNSECGQTAIVPSTYIEVETTGVVMARI